MEKRFWSKLGTQQHGPFPTMQEALDAMRDSLAPSRKAKPRERIMTGYGADGPWFDIQWHEVKKGA